MDRRIGLQSALVLSLTRRLITIVYILLYTIFTYVKKRILNLLTLNCLEIVLNKFIFAV